MYGLFENPNFLMSKSGLPFVASPEGSFATAAKAGVKAIDKTKTAATAVAKKVVFVFIGTNLE
ncbi:hypothetical protein NMT12_30135 [metagenome]